MRHRKKRLQLNRFSSWQKATLISLTKNLFLHQSIKTTLAKAKTVKPLVEKLISLAKSNGLAAKREAFKILGDHKLVSQIFNEIGPRFVNRQGGYTRIIPLGLRRGDNAEIAILEFTEIKKKEIKKPKIEKVAKKEIEKVAQEPVAGKPEEEKKPEKPPIVKKPTKKFFGGLRRIFKKERDSL
jgi:large subunit ribosomal protein L17